jgi:hypothetical protein
MKCIPVRCSSCLWVPRLGGKTRTRLYPHRDNSALRGLTLKPDQLRKLYASASASKMCQLLDGRRAHDSRAGPDTEGDGMPDNFETFYGFNPNDPSDANLDSDAMAYESPGVSSRNESARSQRQLADHRCGKEWQRSQCNSDLQ